MAYMVGIPKATVQRILIFTLFFNELDVKPASAYTSNEEPKIFVETGRGLTDLIIDKTDFKFQYVTNFEFNSLIFIY